MGILRKLTTQLFPTGEAYNFTPNGYVDKLLNAVTEGEEQVVSDIKAILHSILPDSASFDTADAVKWEIALGITPDLSSTLEQRKQVILDKLTHPQDIPARQSAQYMEDTLRAAGFDVYVHENLDGSRIENIVTSNTEQLGDDQLDGNQLGTPISANPDRFAPVGFGDVQLGTHQLGEHAYIDKVVNHLEYEKDVFYKIAEPGLTNVIYVSGATRPEYTDVPANRRSEFRELILLLKRAKCPAILLINYT